MASAARARALLTDAGFARIRTEDVPVRFTVQSVDEYLGVIADTAGPFGLALRDLPDADRAVIGARLGDAFEPFAAEGGYTLPGAALAAVAG
jgi:hypothetical protein